jgi:hypothetical protein
VEDDLGTAAYIVSINTEMKIHWKDLLGLRKGHPEDGNKLEGVVKCWI